MNASEIRKWFKFLRNLVIKNYIKKRSKIGGMNKTVEIDETLITKRKYNRGRVIPQQWLVGGICREDKKTFFELVEKRNSTILIDIINKHVEKGTRIITDSWKGYNLVVENGYPHCKINHSKNFVSPENSTIHTQNIENRWRRLKEFLKTKGSNRRKYISEYLAEFDFRQNCVDVFKELINLIIKG